LNIDKALEIYEEQNDKDGIGKAYIVYATHYWKKNDLETAVEYDKKSLALYEELGDLEGVAINLCGIGIYYSDILKDYEGALAKYERAQNIFEENGYKRHMPYSLNNMVSIKLKTGNYSSAISHLEKLSRVVKELGYGEKVEQSQFNVISSVYTSMGKYKAAIMGLEKGLKVYENINDREMMAYCYAMLGMNHYLDENHEQVLDYLKKSRDISRKIRLTDNDLVIELYSNLTYKHLGQELDLTKLKDLIKETESFGYTTNLFLHQLFKDRVYLENAFIALEKKAEPMSGELKRQFLDFTIPKQIMTLYGKVIS
jgi:tetratricopeptide (TPR) repeat protein